LGMRLVAVSCEKENSRIFDTVISFVYGKLVVNFSYSTVRTQLLLVRFYDCTLGTSNIL
jgi:hypothetical protein